MVDSALVAFIRESRRRGFSDAKIQEALLSNLWPMREIRRGFNALRAETKSKNSVTIWLDSEVREKLEKRAKKNLMTLPEQIEDILRRSVVNTKGTTPTERLDDMLVGLFSRKKRNN